MAGHHVCGLQDRREEEANELIQHRYLHLGTINIY